ncbi:MAG: hypothetical protein PVF76_08345 [Syntrophobacterales bacterium]
MTRRSGDKAARRKKRQMTKHMYLAGTEACPTGHQRIDIKSAIDWSTICSGM